MRKLSEVAKKRYFAEAWLDNSASKNIETFVYGTVPLLPLHIGSDPIFALIKDLLALKLSPSIILGDTFAYMDRKTDIESSEYKNIVDYYRFFLNSLGIPHEKIFLHSNVHTGYEYWSEVLNLSKFFTKRLMIKSVPEHIKIEDSKISDYFHVLFQTADIPYANADLTVGYESQRKIYAVSRELLRRSRDYEFNSVFIKNPVDLNGGDMNKSTSKSRISYHDDKDSLKKKMTLITLENSEILKDIFYFSIFPFKETLSTKQLPVDENNIDQQFKDIDEKDLEELKNISIELLVERFDTYQRYFNKNPNIVSWLDLRKLKGES